MDELCARDTDVTVTFQSAEWGVNEAPLSEGTYEAFRVLLHRRIGIRLHENKLRLARARLTRRLAALGLPSFEQYLLCLEDPKGEEFAIFVDLLTTNLTEFFREPKHFEYIRRDLLVRWSGSSAPIRIWSAGCSSGQEPYSLAMLIKHHSEEIAQRTSILATDICRDALAQARSGVYSAEEASSVPAPYRERFLATRGGDRKGLEVVAGVREMVHFARLNLVSEWVMSGPFDLILCRNVMIYFDREGRRALCERFGGKLRPGAHLFLGHSERVHPDWPGYEVVQPTIYRRAA